MFALILSESLVMISDCQRVTHAHGSTHGLSQNIVDDILLRPSFLELSNDCSANIGKFLISNIRFHFADCFCNAIQF